VGLEKLWGANNLKRIAWLQQGLRSADAVCRIATDTSLGTGFLIANGWVMTNHHVISSKEEAVSAIVNFGFQENIDGSLTESIAYRLEPDSYLYNEEFDVATVLLSGSSGLQDCLSRWGVLSINGTADVETGQHVIIIQHPQGGPKQICMTENQVINIYHHRVQYMTDTMPGSSGSPVFNDNWDVVAIHHAGGNLKKNDRGERLFANEGIRMSYIRKNSELSRVFT
jgi:V8-like Glu-specific endopeptidase